MKADKKPQKREARRNKAAQKAELTKKREAENKRREAERSRAREARAQKRRRVTAAIVKRLKNDRRGFDYDNRGILPRVELTVRGDAPSVFSRFSRAGITVSDSEKTGAFLRFKIRKKDLRKAVAILSEMCYTFTVGKSYGIGRSCAFLLARAGLVLGALAACICVHISYSYVWRVDISGNDRLSEAAIYGALKERGFCPGLKKRDVNVRDVASAASSVDGISDASAELVGTTLYVYVLEADDYTERGRYSAFESAYDATVTRIVARKGEALVSRGDIVRRGDIIADGNVYSTAGELLSGGECDVDVYGEVSVTFTAEIAAEAIEYRRTGRVKKRTGMTFFGCDLFDTSSPFASYESESATANYDVLLPLYVTSHTYYETAPVSVARDIDKAAAEYLAQKSEELCFSGGFRSSYTVTGTVSGLYRVNMFLGGEALISRGIPVG